MAKNVRFIRTTKEKWLARDTYDPLALYFCEDTQEMCKGDKVLTDGIRVVPTKADLPECPYAADGIIYYVAETKNGYMMSPDRTEWLQTIYAPAKDASTIPESEIYKTVTTVGAVRDIENAIYAYIDEEIANVEISGSQGKDGESAYQIWLNAGHSGSEDDFLQWLKGDNDPFGDVVTSIGFDGIAEGTSLKGKTVKDVIIMLLGIKEAPKPVVDCIIDNSIPAYNGTVNNQVEEVEYMLLDADTANYADQGFYTSTDSEGNITGAGYQLTIEGNNDADAQVVSIPANAVIKMAYRYDIGGTNTWLPYTFDTTDEANYWLLSDIFTVTVDGEEVVYQMYAYNIDVVGGGDALTSTEYWRFEIEVTN